MRFDFGRLTLCGLSIVFVGTGCEAPDEPAAPSAVDECADFALEGLHGGPGSYATWNTIECLAALREFGGLDPSIPWTVHHFDPYVGVDTAPCTEAEPCRTLSRAKGLFHYGTRIVWNSDHRFISNRIFPYSPTTGLCVVGETVSHDGGTSRILDVAPDVARVVFETVSGSPVKSVTTFIGNDSGCVWTTGEVIDAIWDGLPGSATLLPEIDCPAEYQDRICALMEASDPGRPVVLNADGGYLDDTTADGPFGVWASDRTHGIAGFENMHCDNVMHDCYTQQGHGRIRVLNGSAKRIKNSADTDNRNCYTTHGRAGDDGSPAGLDAINAECEVFPYDRTAGSPIAPTAATRGQGDSYLVMLGLGPIVANQSEAIEVQSPVAGTGGDLYLVGHELRCDLSDGPAGTCSPISLHSLNGDVTARLARVVLEGSRVGGGDPAAIKLKVRVGGVFDVRLYNATLTNRSADGAGYCWQIATELDPGPHVLQLLDVLADECGLMQGRQVDGPPEDLALTATGVFDSDEGDWYVEGAVRSLAWVQANTGWDFYEDPVTSFDSGGASFDGDQLGVDPEARCLDPAKECYMAADGTHSFEFPVPLWDYLDIPIDGYLERGPRNVGAR